MYNNYCFIYDTSMFYFNIFIGAIQKRKDQFSLTFSSSKWGCIYLVFNYMKWFKMCLTVKEIQFLYM